MSDTDGGWFAGVDPEDPVVHLVLPPRRQSSTTFSDLRDAGYEVVAVAPFPEEIPRCPAAAGYPGCKQVLVRKSFGYDEKLE